LRRAILASTRGGCLVFDPFCGSGTRGMAAKELERFFRGGGDGAGVRRACGAQDRCCGTGGSAARTLCPKCGIGVPQDDSWVAPSESRRIVKGDDVVVVMGVGRGGVDGDDGPQ
jgi:hypothetical protein